jgi:membrane protein YqaA with SNARE-associated domain
LITHKFIRNIIAVVFLFLFAFWLTEIVTQNDSIQSLVARFGYVGVFIVALISGFNVVIPVPTISFLPVFLQSGLQFTPLIIIITLGMTMADLASYYIGQKGRGVLDKKEESKILMHLQTLKTRHQWLPLPLLFIFASIAPLPNEILLIPLGYLGYNIRYLIIPALMGNLVFNTGYAWGIIKLFNIL